MRVHRLAILFGALGCATLGALAPAAGCNGTGVTPMCDFPDGANNPESGCGELVEASVEDAVTSADGQPPMDSSVMDASDATTPPPADSGVEDAHDASDAHIDDAPHDAPQDAPHDAPHDAKG